MFAESQKEESSTQGSAEQKKSKFDSLRTKTQWRDFRYVLVDIFPFLLLGRSFRRFNVPESRSEGNEKRRNNGAGGSGRGGGG